jgi:DNA-binding MarR family transcriptional regulator
MNDALAFTLIHAARRVDDRLEEALSAVKLSGPKAAALNVLVTEDRPVSLSELAERLTCVRSNVTQLVDRMEVEGLVQRTDDPADRRGVWAQLTELGRERHAAGAKVVEAILTEVAQEVSCIDQALLKRALEAIR